MMHRFVATAVAVFLCGLPTLNAQAQTAQAENVFKPSERAVTLFYQGQMLAQQGKFDKAVDAYLQAVALEPKYTQARLSLAILYGKAKQYDKALKEIAVIQKLNPKDFLSYKVQGLLLEDSKSPAAAADAFEMYLKLAPAQQVKDAEELMQRIDSLRKGA